MNVIVVLECLVDKRVRVYCVSKGLKVLEWENNLLLVKGQPEVLRPVFSISEVFGSSEPTTIEEFKSARKLGLLR